MNSYNAWDTKNEFDSNGSHLCQSKIHQLVHCLFPRAQKTVHDQPHIAPDCLPKVASSHSFHSDAFLVFTLDWCDILSPSLCLDLRIADEMTVTIWALSQFQGELPFATILSFYEQVTKVSLIWNWKLNLKPFHRHPSILAFVCLIEPLRPQLSHSGAIIPSHNGLLRKQKS